jgi:hypothetical protein
VSSSGRLTSRNGSPVRIRQGAGWDSEPVWTQRLEKKILCFCRDRTPVVQPVVLHCTDWASPASNSFKTKISAHDLIFWNPDCSSSITASLTRSHSLSSGDSTTSHQAAVLRRSLAPSQLPIYHVDSSVAFYLTSADYVGARARAPTERYQGVLRTPWTSLTISLTFK